MFTLEHYGLPSMAFNDAKGIRGFQYPLSLRYVDDNESLIQYFYSDVDKAILNYFNYYYCHKVYDDINSVDGYLDGGHNRVYICNGLLLTNISVFTYLYNCDVSYFNEEMYNWYSSFTFHVVMSTPYDYRYGDVYINFEQDKISLLGACEMCMNFLDNRETVEDNIVDLVRQIFDSKNLDSVYNLCMNNLMISRHLISFRFASIIFNLLKRYRRYQLMNCE